MLRRQFMLLGAAAAVGCGKRPPNGPLNVPFTTLTVQLIVAQSTMNVEDQGAIQALVAGRNVSATDVLIIKNGQRWEPYSLIGSSLKPHEIAVIENPETVPIVRVRWHEQLQWQSNAEEFTARIAKKNGNLPRFPKKGNGPADPFDRRLETQVGKPNQPIRSGVASRNNDQKYGQLYKLTFTMNIDGNEEIIDPDVYCEWG